MSFFAVVHEVKVVSAYKMNVVFDRNVLLHLNLKLNIHESVHNNPETTQ